PQPPRTTRTLFIATSRLLRRRRQFVYLDQIASVYYSFLAELRPIALNRPKRAPLDRNSPTASYLGITPSCETAKRPPCSGRAFVHVVQPVQHHTTRARADRAGCRPRPILWRL